MKLNYGDIKVSSAGYRFESTQITVFYALSRSKTKLSIIGIKKITICFF